MKERFDTTRKFLLKLAKNNPKDGNQPQPKIVLLALESTACTGFLQPKLVDFLQDLADIANETQKVGSENLMTFIRSISFAFQRAIDTTLSLRSVKLNSHFRKEESGKVFPKRLYRKFLSFLSLRRAFPFLL
jgi:hypothetical protein